MSADDADGRPMTVLAGVRPMSPSGEFLAPTNVGLRGDRIASLAADVHGSDVLDCHGKFLIPGLFDCHVHVTHPGPDIVRGVHRPFSYQFFEAARNLRTILECGITTVRDAGGADMGVAKALEDGLISGPRIHLAVQILSQTGGHTDGWCASGNVIERIGLEHPGKPHGIIDGVDEARRKVRELKRAGANWIKVCSSGGVISVADDPRHPHLRLDELTECVEEAATSATPVMAHAASTVGIKNAIRAGVRSIEHGIYLDSEAVELMVDRDVWLVPTLSAPHALVNLAADGVPVAPQVLDKAKGVLEAHARSFRLALDAGVRIAMGTDSGVGPHGANLDELRLMVEAGMSVPAALVAATSSAADLLGVGDDLGTIAVGRRADLVLLDREISRPSDLDDLASRIEAVFLGGIAVHTTPSSRITPNRLGVA